MNVPVVPPASKTRSDVLNTQNAEASKNSRKQGKDRAKNNTSKRRKRKKKFESDINSQLMLSDNKHTNGSIYTPLQNSGKKGSSSNRDLIVIDSDSEEDISNINPSEENQDSMINSEKPTIEDSNNSGNELENNQDFIAFQFSEDESEDEDDENDSGSESNNKRKRTFSDDGSDEEPLPHKRPDFSLEFPWITRRDLTKNREIADWLTQEIKDFVDYISPSKDEIHARNAAVIRIRKVVSKLWSDAEVRVFGSYATDMYLPGSDIDMVIMSPTGRYDNRSSLYTLSSRLKSSGIAIQVECIAKARVPIIKFVEKESRIHVDVSFERSNGTNAVETIRSWAKQFPCLRYLVMVVKQFLARRKLNNVHAGGLGGFSIICSIANFLTLHPKLASGEIDAEKNLGVLLIEYFELYGKNFNYDRVALKMSSPMGYLIKRDHPNLSSTNRSTFSIAIQDPADPENNISRGSYNIRAIKKAFHGAFDMLTTRCYEIEMLPRKQRYGMSILGNIIKVKGPERDFNDSRDSVMNIVQMDELEGTKGSARTILVNDTDGDDDEDNSYEPTQKKPKYSKSTEFVEISSDEEDDYEPTITINKSTLHHSSSSDDDENYEPTDNRLGTPARPDSGDTTKAGDGIQTPSSGKKSDDSQDSRTNSVSRSVKQSYWSSKGSIVNDISR